MQRHAKEILGAHKALEAAIAADKDSPIKVVIDCQNAVSALRGGQANSSLGLVDNIRERRMPSQDIEVKWIPSHSKMRGNEMADRLAKSGL